MALSSGLRRVAAPVLMWQAWQDSRLKLNGPARQRPVSTDGGRYPELSKKQPVAQLEASGSSSNGHIPLTLAEKRNQRSSGRAHGGGTGRLVSTSKTGWGASKTVGKCGYIGNNVRFIQAVRGDFLIIQKNGVSISRAGPALRGPEPASIGGGQGGGTLPPKGA